MGPMQQLRLVSGLSCKTVILQVSYEMDGYLARLLKDRRRSCKNLARRWLSCKILQVILQDYTLFHNILQGLARILQDDRRFLTRVCHTLLLFGFVLDCAFENLICQKTTDLLWLRCKVPMLSWRQRFCYATF